MASAIFFLFFNEFFLFFNDAEEYDGFYQVSSKPRVVKQNTPLQEYNVLQEAKLRML